MLEVGHLHYLSAKMIYFVKTKVKNSACGAKNAQISAQEFRNRFADPRLQAGATSRGAWKEGRRVYGKARKGWTPIIDWNYATVKYSGIPHCLHNSYFCTRLFNCNGPRHFEVKRSKVKGQDNETSQSWDMTLTCVVTGEWTVVRSSDLVTIIVIGIDNRHVTTS